MLSNKEYVKYEGKVCPYCATEGVQCLSICVRICSKCERKWVEETKVIGFKEWKYP